jgi:uncharacterized Tic20 family protein
MHLSSIFVIVIIPLLLWSWKKNQSYKIDRQGRLVLNFQITMTLCLFAATFLLMIFPVTLAIIETSTHTSVIEGNPIIMAGLICMPLPLILIGIFCTYQGIVNAARALSDKLVHYPLSIPFVK